jgi:hypothetical protein
MKKIQYFFINFTRFLLIIYVMIFLFTNLSIAYLPDKMMKLFIIKFDRLLTNSSDQNLNKLNEILNKYSIIINVKK